MAALTIASIPANHEPFVGFGGVTLRVNQRSWPAGTDLDAVLAGTATPDRIVATSDGRGLAVPFAWHAGDSGAEVYFERYAVEAGELRMVSHGWIDAASRQLVQAG